LHLSANLHFSFNLNASLDSLFFSKNVKPIPTVPQIKSRKVLVAPLDWGLGHASRCVPLIRYLLSIHWEVVLSGEGPSADLLKQEFPNLPIIPLQGYRITYPKNGKWLIPHLISQIPKIIQAIQREKKELADLQQKEKFDLVISDNRYGLHTKDCYSILITHQLHVISGFGKTADWILQKVLYRLIHQFNQCWVPDSEHENNIAGILSHPVELPKNIKFIGPLSRLEKKDSKDQTQYIEKKENSILVLLSGLEPQRTQLEEKLLEQLSHIDLPVTFVRGIPVGGEREKGIGNRETAEPTTHNSQPTTNFPSSKEGCRPKGGGVVIQPKTQTPKLNFLTASELEKAMPDFSLVICRSGYSSIMDLLKVQKKAILIPTPGQTEQEYLGKRLAEKGYFVCQSQDKLNLSQALADCKNTNPAALSLDFENFKKAFRELGIS
jgi:hypothetical protein